MLNKYYFLANTVLHYKGIIDHWEIWNEPDSSFLHSLGGESQKAKDYAKRLQKHHAVIVAAMQAKQNVDAKHAEKLKQAIEALTVYYPEHKH